MDGAEEGGRLERKGKTKGGSQTSKVEEEVEREIVSLSH